MEQLNLELLNDIDNNSMRVSVTLKDEYKNKLKDYTDILNRLENTIHFANSINIEKNSTLSEGYFRASLSELISIEEILKNTYKLSIGIYNSKHPLLILLKMIRNINVHLKTNTLNHKKNSVKWQEKEFLMAVVYIDNLTMKILSDVDNFKKYYKKESENYNNLLKSLNWFNDLCKDIGLIEVLFSAVDIFACFIINEIDTIENN